MVSVRSFLHACERFFGYLADVQPKWLAAASFLLVVNLILRSRAWHNILRASYPDSNVRARDAAAAYMIGVGVNTFAPARGGDLVKVYVIDQKVEEANAPTTVATLIVETIFDFFAGGTLLAWAYATGAIPRLPEIPHAPVFEFSLIARHETAAAIIALVVIAAGFVAVRWASHHVRRFWARVEQGVAILRTPSRYLWTVVPYQALGWGCRIASAYYMLEAFNVEPTIRRALLVVAVGVVSTMLPFTPGGAGAQQALLAIVLAGAASSAEILAFSVGNQAVATVTSALVGVLAMLIVFRHVRVSRLRTHAATTPEPEPR